MINVKVDVERDCFHFKCVFFLRQYIDMNVYLFFGLDMSDMPSVKLLHWIRILIRAEAHKNENFFYVTKIRGKK